MNQHLLYIPIRYHRSEESPNSAPPVAVLDRRISVKPRTVNVGTRYATWYVRMIRRDVIDSGFALEDLPQFYHPSNPSMMYDVWCADSGRSA